MAERKGKERIKKKKYLQGRAKRKNKRNNG